jgi:release factor glutamine methyltransferase
MMHTLLEIIQRTTEFFAKRGIESPRLNAELLIGHALGLKRMQLYLQFERPLAEPELAKLRPLVKRRGDREPLQHIVGETDFGGLKLKVDRRALVPRPETEMLVALLVERLVPPPGRVLDLGTGSGAIALALAKAWPEAAIRGVDVDGAALALAKENAAATGLERVVFAESDWFQRVPAADQFDLIVANPPYLSEAEVAAAQPEVKDFDPRGALTPGADGLAALRVILAEAKAHLAPGGLLACETGIDQHAALKRLAEAAGYARTESVADLTKRDRFFLAAV